MAVSHSACFITFNMHGYNQGVEYLKDLCTYGDVICIQEHWLYPGDLHLLNEIDNEFVCFSCSAMNDTVKKGVMFGRLFGGVAILVRTALAVHTKLIHKSDRFFIIQYFDTLIVNVYMPSKSVKKLH